MEAETIGAQPPASGAPKFGDQVSDRVHVEESPRISTCTELTAFSEATDLQAERNYHDSTCVNARVDDEEREGAVERERLSGTAYSGCEQDHSDQAACCRSSDVCHCVHHHHQGSSASEHCNNQHSRCDLPSSADINDCVQPSSTTNLCDAPSRCADVVDSTLQTTNQG